MTSAASRRGRAPRRGGAGRRVRRRRRRCPPPGRRARRIARSTVATVNRSGWLPRTSSQSSGVDTRASGSGRMEYAEATVRSFAFWLKSTNTLSPRSSFHQRAVASPGARNSTSRARVSAASRTSRNVPARLDADVDVHATRPRRLRPADQAVVGEHLTHHHRDVDDLAPVHARHRVEVDPQLVGVVEVLRAHRVRVEVDAAEVHDPGERGGIPHHDLFRRVAGGVVQGRGVDPLGPLLGRALLEERLLRDALHEALQHHRPSGGAAQGAVGHAQVVAHEVELREPGLGEHHLVGVADPHLATVDLEELGVVLGGTHSFTLGASAAGPEPLARVALIPAARPERRRRMPRPVPPAATTHASRPPTRRGRIGAASRRSPRGTRA